MVSYKNMAIDAISKMIGYDPYLPQTEAMVNAYAEALSSSRIDRLDDVLEAVRVMYERNGDPGWRATPKVLVVTAREVKAARLKREEQEREASDTRERISFAEFRRRHPEVEFPKLGRDPVDAG